MSVQARLSNGPCAVGRGAYLQMGAAVSTSAANPSADVQAQRDRSLGDDAQDGLAAMQPACAVKLALLIKV